jgi:hypothetical protein
MVRKLEELVNCALVPAPCARTAQPNSGGMTTKNRNIQAAAIASAASPSSAGPLIE